MYDTKRTKFLVQRSVFGAAMWQQLHSYLIVPLMALTVLVSACGGSTAQTRRSTPSANSAIPSVTSRDRGSLPFDCPHPGQPVFQSNAQIVIHPDHGPVGTVVAVSISGVQPGCHLFLDLEIAPSLAETSGTPRPAPLLATTGLQWIQISTGGTVDTTFCVCKRIDLYALGYPPYPSVTPVLGQGVTNVGEYAPAPGDYFFLTIATPDLARPTVFIKFTVTQ